MATINQFKANLIGAGPRNNRFEVFLPRAGNKIQFLCKTASLPGQTIDEFPIFCVAAAMAKGKTTVTGAEELRVKETDRIKAMAIELKKLNVEIQETPDGFAIEGKSTIQGGYCQSYGDHRVAMALAIAALPAHTPTQIENTSCIETSFPGFHDKLLELLTNSN